MIQLRLLKLGAMLLLITAVSLIILVASGMFDPQPIGFVVWHEEQHPMTVPAQTQQIEWLYQPVPAGSFSVRLTAVYQQGAMDSAYGLILGDTTQNLLVAVSPLGYATIQKNGSALFPWQPWPHVRTQNTPNEIWLDWADDQLSIRLNRELLWSGDVEIPEGDLGLYGESFAETAVFNFESIELYREENN